MWWVVRVGPSCQRSQSHQDTWCVSSLTQRELHVNAESEGSRYLVGQTPGLRAGRARPSPPWKS